MLNIYSESYTALSKEYIPCLQNLFDIKYIPTASEKNIVEKHIINLSFYFLKCTCDLTLLIMITLSYASTLLLLIFTSFMYLFSSSSSYSFSFSCITHHISSFVIISFARHTLLMHCVIYSAVECYAWERGALGLVLDAGFT